MAKKLFLKRIFVLVVAFLMISLPVASTYALSESMLDMFANNNILFYDPSEKKTDGQCGNVGGGNNQNYAGAIIYSDAEMQTIEANRPFYEKAAEKYNFPWQILAVIHYRETRLGRTNPGNGEGAYQLTSYVNANNTKFLPAGAISDDEFQRQTDIAASVIDGKAKGLDLNTDDGVKTLFFRYNGVAGAYKQQALDLGFTSEEASHGEGSPYVMNRYDEKRDPTVEPTKSNNTWGQIKVNNGPIEYPANSDFGAYVYYIAIGGSAGDCSSGALVSGGMTLEQAKEFMQYYYNAAAQYEGKDEDVTLDGMFFKKYSSCSSALNNCVAFSRWFLGTYTTMGPGVPGTDGGGLAKLVANKYNLTLSQTPRAYAVFSRSTPTQDNPDNGHTGIVLGVDEAAGVIYTGEAACGKNYTIKNVGVQTRKISDVTGGNWYYAYTDTMLKDGI